ncbi:hypothetical protein JB92DRAFT_2833955 [Gautieria morchelliformis]|nr:hypothetical protein JB92DRAFT_2833955 [Gautieria morchelliformis]
MLIVRMLPGDTGTGEYMKGMDGRLLGGGRLVDGEWAQRAGNEKDHSQHRPPTAGISTLDSLPRNRWGIELGTVRVYELAACNIGRGSPEAARVVRSNTVTSEVMLTRMVRCTSSAQAASPRHAHKARIGLGSRSPEACKPNHTSREARACSDHPAPCLYSRLPAARSAAFPVATHHTWRCNRLYAPVNYVRIGILRSLDL